VLDRFSDVVVEARLRSILDLILHRIRGQSHDGNLGIVVLLFPAPNLTASVVAVLHGHLDVALWIKLADPVWPLKGKDLPYNDERVVTWLFRKH